MAIPDPERPFDHTDYERRMRVNIAVGLGLAALLGILIWSVQAVEESERLQRCYASGRRDCVPLKVPPPRGPAGSRSAPLT